MVLVYYLHPDFQSVEKPKGGPLEIEIFFVEGGKLKPPSDFFQTKKSESKMCSQITRKYRSF